MSQAPCRCWVLCDGGSGRWTHCNGVWTVEVPVVVVVFLTRRDEVVMKMEVLVVLV